MKKATKAQATVLAALRHGARLDTWHDGGLYAYLRRSGGDTTVRMPTFFCLLENGWIREMASEGRHVMYCATHAGYDALDAYEAVTRAGRGRGGRDAAHLD